MTKLGFYSIVLVKNQKQYQIRARSRQDLENLLKAINAEKINIIETTDSDYRFRILVWSSNDMKAIFEVLCKSIDYDNFKRMIAGSPDQHEKSMYYGDIWGTMWNYQNEKHNERKAGLHDTIEDGDKF